jgi:hypothetical protein
VRDPALGAAHLYVEVPGWAAGDPDGWAEALAGELRIRGGRPRPHRAVRSLLTGGEAPDRMGARLPHLVRRALPFLPPVTVSGTGPAAPFEWTVEVDDPVLPEATLRGWAAGGVTRVSLRGGAVEAGGVHRSVQAGLLVDVQLPLGAGNGAEAGARLRALVRAGATSCTLEEVEGEGAGGDPAPGPGGWGEAVSVLQQEGWVLPELARGHREGAAPRHPMAILRREPVLGLGPGAVSFRNPFRRWNHRDRATYLEAVRAGVDPVADGERLGRAQVRLERVWLALRRARGIRCPDPDGPTAPTAGWVERGWGRRRAGRIVPTLEGWARADELAVTLAAELDLRGGGDTGAGGTSGVRGSTGGHEPENFRG